ncbi:MAG: MinD/ParA family protein [Bacillota bacterium]|nr:MinD/ParA family protein [Bacillota bacterium]
MKDQAESLRLKLTSSEKNSRTKAIAVVSGKGGVGKSNLSLNFSLSLAKSGSSVLLLDMDIGMGNIDILMGRTSDKTIVDYLSGASSLKDVVLEGLGGIHYIAGGSGLSRLVKMEESHVQVLFEEMDTLLGGYDYLIFDMGAGINEESLKFLLSVDEIFVVTTPEPTSIMDAYATIKYLHLVNPEIPFYLIVNKVQTSNDGKDTLQRLSNVLKRFLDREAISLGSIPDDRTIQQAVSRQIPFLNFNPKSAASKALEEITTRYKQAQFTEQSSLPKIPFVTKLKKFFFER